MTCLRVLLAAVVLLAACDDAPAPIEVDAETRVRRMDMDPPPMPDAAVMDAAPVMDMAPPPPDMGFNDSNVMARVLDGETNERSALGQQQSAWRLSLQWRLPWIR